MFYDNLRHFIVDSAKLPAIVLAWKNFQEVFVMLVVVAVVFTSLEVFHFIAFRRHASSFRELVRVLRFWVGVFFTYGRFLPYTLWFVTQMRAGTPHPGSPCACSHSVVPSSWRMEFNYWCLNFKTIYLSIVPVSHEV